MTTFKLGDRVRIIKGTRYYGFNSVNPADVDGEIISSLGHSLRVRWSNTGEVNLYSSSDLEHISLERLMDEFIKEDKANA